MKTITNRVAMTLLSLLLVHEFAFAQGGAYNYIAGDGAGYYNIGNLNAFVGYRCGTFNRAGWGNTFLGSFSGELSTGNFNTFIGSSAGANNAEAISNTYIGYASGQGGTSGESNCTLGAYSGYSLGTASHNVFLGYRTGYYSTAEDNTFIGSMAGERNVSGTLNVFIGRFAGNANTSGLNNTFVGSFAGDVNTTGANNTFVGQNAGGRNTTGQRNGYFGTQAGELTTTGSDNVFIGRQAGRNNTTGSFNTTLGNYAQLSNGTLTNAAAIGYKAIVRTSNAMVLGSINGQNGATATVNVGIGTPTPAYNLHVNGTAAKPGGGSWTVASDKRLKQNIKPFTEGLNAITQVNPVWFQYNGKAGLPTNQTYVGVIAQDMQKVAPYTVGKFTYDNEGQTETYLDYDANALTYALVNAVKELNAISQQQNEQIKKLLDRIAILEAKTPGTSSSEGIAAKLWQNSPNPYASSTVIKYFIPEDVRDAQIQVISITGQEVYSRHLTDKGESQIEISNQMLSPGAYVYQLIVNGTVIDTKKMILGK